MDPPSLTSLTAGSSPTETSLTVCSEVNENLERRAVLKLDLTLLPMMVLFYLLSFMDRANIGNARIAGFQHDLGLTDKQYQICVCILYATYAFSDIPSNLLMRNIGAHLILPALVTVWGLVVTLQGFVTSYAGLIVIRLVLGTLEGPIFPGMVLYLSGFYTRQELSFRVAVFFSSASLSGAFSGLFAAALVQLDGAGGRPGWAWIFIVEGILTVAFGLLGFYTIPRTPNEARFLPVPQRQALVNRLARSMPHTKYADKFSVAQSLRALSAPHTILMLIAAFVSGCNNLGIANFLPSIVKQLGYPSTTSQLLTVGPYAAAFCVTLPTAYFSDRHNIRSIPIIITSIIAITGYAIYLTSHDKHLSYASLFLIVSGSYGGAPLLICWLANNSEPHYRRATNIAMASIASSSGAILSIWRFPSKEGPRFTHTTIMNLCFAASVTTIAVLNALYLANQNRKKKERRLELLAPYADTNEKAGYDQTKAWNELGDRHPDFRYIL